MNTEIVLASIVAKVTEILKTVVSQTEVATTPPTRYDLEERTQAVLPQIGQVLLQELVSGQGAGVIGPERPCVCGDQQR